MFLNGLFIKLKSHYCQYFYKKPLQIICQFLFENVFLAFIIGYIIIFFFPKYNKDPFSDISIYLLIISAVIIAPFVETLLFQTIPISFAIKYKRSLIIQLLSSILPFSIIHILQYGLIGLVSGVIGGYYLSLSYVIWRKQNNRYAFFLTVLTHSIYNLIILAIYLNIRQ
jgi:hypothetical protein